MCCSDHWQVFLTLPYLQYIQKLKFLDLWGGCLKTLLKAKDQQSTRTWYQPVGHWLHRHSVSVLFWQRQNNRYKKLNPSHVKPMSMRETEKCLQLNLSHCSSCTFRQDDRPFTAVCRKGRLKCSHNQGVDSYYTQTNAALHLPWKLDFRAGHDVAPDLTALHLYKSENQYGDMFKTFQRLIDSYRLFQFISTCFTVLYQSFTKNLIKNIPNNL